MIEYQSNCYAPWCILHEPSRRRNAIDVQKDIDANQLQNIPELSRLRTAGMLNPFVLRPTLIVYVQPVPWWATDWVSNWFVYFQRWSHLGFMAAGRSPGENKTMRPKPFTDGCNIPQTEETNGLSRWPVDLWCNALSGPLPQRHDISRLLPGFLRPWFYPIIYQLHIIVYSLPHFGGHVMSLRLANWSENVSFGQYDRLPNINGGAPGEWPFSSNMTKWKIRIPAVC